MIAALFTASLDPAELPLRILALVGCTALGAFLLSGAGHVLTKTLIARRMPTRLIWPVRVTGGTASGLLALWLMGGGGGWGLGGPGGTGPGEGTYPTAQDGSEQQPTPAPPQPLLSPDDTLRIEVLGPDALARIPGSAPERVYRVETAAGRQLLTFKQLEAYVERRVAQTEPPLRRIEIVLYLDSPARGVYAVERVVRLAEGVTVDGKKVRVDYSAPGENAPVP